ncbi:MAG: cupredoxin family copper-binding protein [Chloroflexi bacterium]|nr:cupredoxin family copper-binding protein [Chloroflexota bacterium]
MFLVPVFVLLAVVLLAWLVAQWPVRGGDATPLDIARRRLAAGEITDAQFHEIEQVLGGPGPTAPQQRGFVLLLALLGGLVFVVMSVWMVAWTARGDDWGWSNSRGMMGGYNVWGWDHMSRMMRWDRSPAGATTLETDAPEIAVQIRDFVYTPQTVSIKVGARVTWTNADAVPHTATDRDRRWDTGTFAGGQSASQTFSSAGTYRYYCTLHPSMLGTVTVRP